MRARALDAVVGVQRRERRGGHGAGPKLGLGLSNAQLVELQRGLDVDGSGEIDFNEFVQGVPRLLARTYEGHYQNLGSMTPIEQRQWLDTPLSLSSSTDVSSAELHVRAAPARAAIEDADLPSLQEVEPQSEAESCASSTASRARQAQIIAKRKELLQIEIQELEMMSPRVRDDRVALEQAGNSFEAVRVPAQAGHPPA